eukprot:9496149-Pyramimonas_sp.AAC.1
METQARQGVAKQLDHVNRQLLEKPELRHDLQGEVIGEHAQRRREACSAVDLKGVHHGHEVAHGRQHEELD